MQKYQVLFVDDDRAAGYIVSRFKVWENSDFTLKSIARSSTEALKILEKEFYDLVITDIRMPGMDGLELIRLIREKYRGTVCVISSTYTDFQYAGRECAWEQQTTYPNPSQTGKWRRVLRL